MQPSSIRVSVIALCTLAALTACKQEPPVSQADPLPPDIDTDGAEAAGAENGLTGGMAQVNRPETLNPERLARLNTSMGSLPRVGARNYASVQRSPLPKLNSTLPPLPRLIWPQAPNRRLTPSSAAASAPKPSEAAASTNSAVVPNLPSSAPATAAPEMASPSSSRTLPQRLAQTSPAPVDLQGHWSQPLVTALVNAGIIQGFADGSFQPDAAITQEQFTSMVQRAFPNEEIDPTQIPLTPGMTRAEAAKVIYQALADQGKIAPLAATVAMQNQPFSPEPSLAQPATSASPAESPEAAAPTSPAAATAQPPELSTTVSGDRLQQSPLQLDTPEIVQPEVVNFEASPMPGTAESSVSNQGSNQGSNQESPVAPLVQPESATPVPQASNPAALSVAVMGEVQRPGAYRLSSAGDRQPTLLQAIQMAGGVTPTANIREIQVRRGEANQTVTLDLWQILQSGALSQDMLLQPGDTVMISRAADLTEKNDSPRPAATDRIQVSVVGDVSKPGRLDLPSNTPASQAILASGGLSGQDRKAELIRLNANGTIARRAIAINAVQSGNEATNPVLHNEDVILVYRAAIPLASEATPSTLASLLGVLPTPSAF